MKKIKKYWKEISIVFLAILFVSNCTGKGNYRRKYEKQIKLTEFVEDSMKNVYNNSEKVIDSLRNNINILNQKISSLENEIEIYRDQNTKLANKPVVVKVTSNKAK